MTDNCLNCGGLIMKPNVNYGYAGPVCVCPKNPNTQYQMPSKKIGYISIQEHQALLEQAVAGEVARCIKIAQEQQEELRRQNEVMSWSLEAILGEAYDNSTNDFVYFEKHHKIAKEALDNCKLKGGTINE